MTASASSGAALDESSHVVASNRARSPFRSHPYLVLLRTACALVTLGGRAGAQSDGIDRLAERGPSFSNQLWANAVLDWRVSRPLMLELDLEPKTSVTGGQAFRSADATVMAEVYPGEWCDLTFELGGSYARQSDTVTSVAFAPRAGIRTYPPQIFGSAIPKSKITVAVWNRIELRDFHFVGARGDLDAADWRVRTRFELRFGVDLPGAEVPHPLYFLGDGEVFVFLVDRVPERFSHKLRARVGAGYRVSRHLAFEVLFLRDWTRSTLAGVFETEANILDLRVRLYL